MECRALGLESACLISEVPLARSSSPQGAGRGSRERPTARRRPGSHRPRSSGPGRGPQRRVGVLEAGAERQGLALRGLGRADRPLRLHPRRDPQGANQPVGALERYDLNTGRSVLLRSLPVGIDHVGLATYKGDLIAVGGNPTEGATTGPTSAIADVYRYDTAKNSWSKLTALPDGTRGGAAVGVIGDRLFVVGGARPRPGETSSDTLATLEIYDFKRRTWKQGPAMPTPRTHLGGVAVNGYLYAIGGSTIAGFGGQNLTTVERFNARTNRWERMPSMPRTHWAFGLVEVAGRIRSSVGSAAAA